jgi:hypothetical protein
MSVFVEVVCYAPYVEAAHKNFIETSLLYRNKIIDDSPYDDYIPIDINEAFFGYGYLISSFPSLYDSFGKFMAGLDIESIWNTVFKKIFGESGINESVSEEMSFFDDRKFKDILSEIKIKMRDINAVISSTFVIGKAIAEDKRIKAFARISLEIKMGLLDVIEKEYANYLNWKKKLIIEYAKIMKSYFMTADRVTDINYHITSSDALWPFKVLSSEGKNIGALQRVSRLRTEEMVRRRSTLSKALSIAADMVTGASIGYVVSESPYGAIIGAVVGLIAGIARIFLE